MRLRARFNKDQRRQIIFSVCHANRVIYDVMRMLGSGKMWTLPYIETGKEKVDPLRNERVVNVLTKQGNERCCVLWSFGQEGDEEHKLRNPTGIATKHRGQFLTADNADKTVKVFDSNGKFDFRFNPQTDDADTKLDILDVATADEDDRIYLLVDLKKPGAEEWERESEVQVFNCSVAVVSSVAVWSSHLSTNRMGFCFFQSKCVVIVSSSCDFPTRGGL